MPYKYRLTTSKYTILRRHRRLIWLLSFLLVLFMSSCLLFIWYISQADNSGQPQTDIRSKSFNPLKTFETPYFTFKTDKSWSFMNKESTQNVFVYRSSQKNIVRRDLTVYVNSLPDNLLLTRVLPVEAEDDHLVIGEISSHCRDYLRGRIQPANNSPIEGSVESVRIKCQIDGTSNTVGTGKKNGSYQISLTGKSGQSNKYYLLYHDLQFTPQLGDFANIARSFHVK